MATRSDPERRGSAPVPRVLTTDRRLVLPIVAGLTRAGKDVRVRVEVGQDGPDPASVTEHPGAGDVEAVVSAHDPAAITEILAEADGRASARLLPVLSLAPDGSLGAESVRMLTADGVDDLNVAVPVLEDPQRRNLWQSLFGAAIEDRHRLVEVAAHPALTGQPEEERLTAALGSPAILAACAAGILAGRMAVGDRRWRPDRLPGP